MQRRRWKCGWTLHCFEAVCRYLDLLQLSLKIIRTFCHRRRRLLTISLLTEVELLPSSCNYVDLTLSSILITAIEKQIPPNPVIDRMGGELLTNALRWFIISMIKHLGLLPKVMKPDRSIGTDKLLVKIWLESRKLRQWIGGERRRILLEREEQKEKKETQPQATGKAPANDDELKVVTGGKLSYFEKYNIIRGTISKRS